MGFLDRLFGTEPQQNAPAVPPYGQPNGQQRVPVSVGARSDDEIALERYRYLLRTAPPETIEQVHREAYGQLTDEQRGMLLTELSASAPAGEAPKSSSPDDLAKAATRAELRQPGTLERTYQAPSFLAMFGSSMLGSIAGYVVASAIMSAFLPPMDASSDASADSAGDASADSGADSGAGADAGATDSGATDSGFGGDWGAGSDAGGGFGDFGGGFGDFGGF